MSVFISRIHPKNLKKSRKNRLQRIFLRKLHRSQLLRSSRNLKSMRGSFWRECELHKKRIVITGSDDTEGNDYGCFAGDYSTNKKIYGTAFAVNCFYLGELKSCKNYFLTHFHSDHSKGCRPHLIMARYSTRPPPPIWSECSSKYQRNISNL